MMLPLVVGFAAVAFAGWLWSTRHPWKVVRNVAPVPWARVLPDAAARWSVDRARVGVLFEPASGVAGSGPARQAWIVQVERQTGPETMRGRVVSSMPAETPATWAPSPGDVVEFGTSDVFGIV